MRCSHSTLFFHNSSTFFLPIKMLERVSMTQETLLIAFAALLFILLVVAMNLQTHFLSFGSQSKEGFQPEQQPSLESPAASMVKEVISPMMDERLCPIFQETRDKITLMMSTESPPSIKDPAAIKAATEFLTQAIPPGPITCPYPRFPADTAPLKTWLEFVRTLPTNLGARSLGTAMYLRLKMREKINEFKSATEGFESLGPLVPPTLQSRKKEPFINAPEAIESDELLLKAIQARLIEIQSTSTTEIKSLITQFVGTAAPTPEFTAAATSLKAVVDDCVKLQKQIKEIEQKAASGNIPHPVPAANVPSII
jgi:hypothetical protein